MIVTMDEAMEIVRDCKLVATKVVVGYNGAKLCDLQQYAGRHGSGYTVTQRKVRQYWCYPVNQIGEDVYNGDYSINDACMTANNIHRIKYNGVLIVPTWRLEIDTLTGDNAIMTTDESLKPITLAGHKLTVMWRGSIQCETLRRKIRRKMKALLRSGNAELVK